MGVLLYVLISGHVFYWGLLLVASGVVGSTWRPRLGGILAWSGLVLTLASAVPIASPVYALLFLLVACWQVRRARSARLNRWMATSVLAGAALALAAALLDRDRARITLSPSRPVFVIGDSLSEGMGSPREKTWPQLVSTGIKLNVRNLARAGATLADGKVQAGAIPEGPATVLVELGGNDLLSRTSAATFETDLHSLLAAVVAQDRSVLMFELPLLPLQNAFGRIQREACRKYGVVLLPRSLLAGAVALPGHTNDGLHLSAAGHAWLAGRVGELWPQT